MSAAKKPSPTRHILSPPPHDSPLTTPHSPLPEFRQPFPGLAQRLIALGEHEAHQMPAQFTRVVEAATRHTGDADGFDHVPGEFGVVGAAQRPNVSEDVIGPFWL